MKKLISLLALLIFFALVSCKAYINPANLKPKYIIGSPELADKIHGLQNLIVGDEIKVFGKDDSVLFLKYEGFDSDFILGDLNTQNGKKIKESKNIKIPLSEIDYIKVKRKSLGATMAWGLGLGVVTAVAVTVVLEDLYNEIGPDDL